MPLTSMKAIATHSMAGDWKWPMLASCVENPPVAMVVKAWLTASKPFMPAKKKHAAQAMVRNR